MLEPESRSECRDRGMAVWKCPIGCPLEIEKTLNKDDRNGILNVRSKKRRLDWEAPT
jgi:hypothetical protein